MERIAAIPRHIHPAAGSQTNKPLHSSNEATVLCRRCVVVGSRRYAGFSCTANDGIIGLGETTIQPAAVEARVHETIAQYLLGQPAHGLGTKLRDDFLTSNDVTIRERSL